MFWQAMAGDIGGQGFRGIQTTDDAHVTRHTSHVRSPHRVTENSEQVITNEMKIVIIRGECKRQNERSPIDDLASSAASLADAGACHHTSSYISRIYNTRPKHLKHQAPA